MPGNVLFQGLLAHKALGCLLQLPAQSLQLPGVIHPEGVQRRGEVFCDLELGRELLFKLLFQLRDLSQQGALGQFRLCALGLQGCAQRLQLSKLGLLLSDCFCQFLTMGQLCLRLQQGLMQGMKLRFRFLSAKPQLLCRRGRVRDLHISFHAP